MKEVDYKNAFWGVVFTLGGIGFVVMAAIIYQLVQHALGFCPTT